MDSDAGRYWAETLFPNIDVCERMGIKEHLWNDYQRLRPQIIAIETLIANGFISPELMHDLHPDALSGAAVNPTLSALAEEQVKKLSAQTSDYLKDID